MVEMHPRLVREQRTVEAMIDLYCRRHHATGHVQCQACQALAGYARLRLEKCPFQQDKPTCAHCSIHCYRPEMRERVRDVMRYAGPRMLFRHPVLAVLHLIDGRRVEPARVRPAKPVVSTANPQSPSFLESKPEKGGSQAT